jgi:hypothetical protein
VNSVFITAKIGGSSSWLGTTALAMLYFESATERTAGIIAAPLATIA